MLKREKISLFDLLKGSFDAVPGPDNPHHEGFEGYFDQFSEQERIELSIVDNLARIFNTRRSTTSYLDNFGIPNDIMERFRDHSKGPEDVGQDIKETIEKYEPRLDVKEVQVWRGDQEDPMKDELMKAKVIEAKEGASAMLNVRIVASIKGDSGDGINRSIITGFSQERFETFSFDAA